MSENSGAGLVRRESGILVPAVFAHAKIADAPAAPARWPLVTRDPDGRRRMALTKEDQRLIDRALMRLGHTNVGMMVCCREGKMADGTPTCGKPMINEGRGTPDAGYGCECSRIHFL